MFTIQYQKPNGESGMQTFDSNSRVKLVKHLSSFSAPILAVYEQASPITKAVRAALAEYPPSQLSRAAKDFVTASKCPA